MHAIKIVPFDIVPFNTGRGNLLGLLRICGETPV
jgi:hypothetical protein